MNLEAKKETQTTVKVKKINLDVVRVKLQTLP